EQQRLGWSFYATENTVEQCMLKQGALSYRGQYTIEQGLGRLKGLPLALLPWFLKIENRAVGLNHLLVIALRALCVAHVAARLTLAEAEVESERRIKGLYEGQKSRGISRPTSEAMLKAFEGISLMVGTDERGRTVTWLTPLSELQNRIIDLFG